MGVFLVTGAAGFIGSALAKRLLKDGNDVVTIDNLTTGYVSAIPDGIKFIKGNCQDEKIIKSLEAYKFDAIYHIAGQSSGEISYDDPVYDLQSNTQSTLLLLKYAIKNECRKFIYASSMSVYGAQPDTNISESSLTQPESLYGVGKLASEHYLRLYQKYGIDTFSLRLFNVYGPGQNMENLRQGMVSIYLAQALKNKHILVKGSADRYRDLVYIDDVVDAFVRCLEYRFNEAKIYNVGTGVRTTVKTLIESIQGGLPEKVSVEYRGNTPGDIFGIYADIDKINKELAWKPKYNVQQGLENMINWAKGGE